MKVLNAFKLCRQRAEYTCGPASLQIALSYFGDGFSQQDLARFTQVTKEYGTLEKDLVWAARQLGYCVRYESRTTLSRVRKSIDGCSPVIVLFKSWKTIHYSVVVGYTKTHLILADPYKRGVIRTIRNDLFYNRWKGECGENKWMMAIKQSRC